VIVAAGVEARPATAPAVRAPVSAWNAVPLAERIAVVSRLRRALARDPEPLVRSLRLPTRASDAESLASEIVPLADAVRFLEREAPALLATRRLGRRGRPGWLRGVDVEVERVPHGRVLVIGPSNYPLFLPGVQSLQALVAGNDVWWKPGRGGTGAAAALAGLLRDAGLPEGALRILPEDEAEAVQAIEHHADLVVLTGSVDTARAVLARCAARPVPAIVEASGCDAVFVLDGADPARVADALAFGLRWNGGATCIAPRRVFVPGRMVRELERALLRRIETTEPAAVDPRAAARGIEWAMEAVAEGASVVHGDLRPRQRMRPLVLSNARPGMRLLREDLFAPILALVPVESAEEALAADGLCPFALGASVFGPRDLARPFARRVRAGTVTVHDLIVPTADPRVAFGGFGSSGFGKTRGAEGLLAMTVTKTISVRRGRFLPHLAPPDPRQERLFRAWLSAAHGGGALRRIRGLVSLVRAALDKESDR
jgi:acyl-CoA reductase-like NAD-dependent aldehyde dehydrogenase